MRIACWCVVSCLYTVMIYIFTEVDEDCVLVRGELSVYSNDIYIYRGR